MTNPDEPDPSAGSVKASIGALLRSGGLNVYTSLPTPRAAAGHGLRRGRRPRVRRAASGWKHWLGWREEWGPEPC